MTAAIVTVPTSPRSVLTQTWARAIQAIGIGTPIHVEQNGKRPTKAGWTTTRYATVDEAGAAFSNHKGNVGIAIAPHLFVADCDTKHGVNGLESLKARARELGVEVPATLTQRTPNNGLHLVFQLPAGTTIGNAVGVLPGLDIRAAGGQIVAQPSVIDDRPYEWVRDANGKFADVAECPAVLVADLCAKASKPAAVAGDAEAEIASGSRNDTLALLGSRARTVAGLSPDAILAALRVENEARCVPPLDDDEVEQIAASVGRHAAPREASTMGFGEAPLPPGASLTPIVQAIPAAPTAPARAARVSLADLDTDPEPAQIFYIEGIVPAGFLTLLGAHGGVGKTLWALQAAVCLAAGLPFLGLTTKRCRVVFYSAEDPTPVLRRRLRKLCRALGVDPVPLAEWLLVLDATDDPVLYDGNPTAALAHLREDIAEFAPGVVIVDNASDTFDAKEIERAAVRAFIRHLVSLGKSLDAGVVLLAHVDKNTAKAGGSESYSGSTAWHNSARSRLVLTVDGAVLCLEHAKSNLGPLSAPLYLARTEDGVFVSTEAPGGADDEAIVLQLLAEANARGENVSPAVRAPNNAHAVLSVDPRFPKNLKSGDVARVVRSLKASGRVVDETYRKDRQDRQRLRVVGEVGAPEKTGEEF